MGKFSLGSEIILHKGVTFYLRRTGGRRYGHYLENWLYIQPAPKLMFGHAESGSYTRGSFLMLPPTQKIGELILATQDSAIKDLALKHQAALSVLGQTLFYKKFCHVTVNREIHVSWPELFFRPYVLRYIVAPSEGSEHLDALLELMECFSLKPTTDQKSS